MGAMGKINEWGEVKQERRSQWAMLEGWSVSKPERIANTDLDILPLYSLKRRLETDEDKSIH
jgi:hypothetical protein